MNTRHITSMNECIATHVVPCWLLKTDKKAKQRQSLNNIQQENLTNQLHTTPQDS